MNKTQECDYGSFSYLIFMSANLNISMEIMLLWSNFILHHRCTAICDEMHELFMHHKFLLYVFFFTPQVKTGRKKNYCM